MAKLYKITTKRGFPAEERRRAGLTIPRGGQLVTELTKDQKEAIENDSYLEIVEAQEGDESQAAVVSEGAGVASNANNGPTWPSDQAGDSGQAAEDQAAEQAQTPSGDAAATDEQVEENQSAPAGDAPGGVAPTEPVSGELDSQDTPGAGAEPTEGLTPTEPVSGEAGAGVENGEENKSDEESSAAAEGQQSVENSQSEEVLPTVDDLVRDNDRPTLDKMAAEAGVADADKMQNKVEVATAIVEKRA